MRSIKIILTVIVIFMFLPAFPQSNTGYERIPFSVAEEGYIVIPTTIFDKEFKLSFSTVGNMNDLTEKGMFKVSKILGQDLKDYIYSKTAAQNPELTHKELTEWVNWLLSGQTYIFHTTSMSCGNFHFPEQKFRASRISIPVDGVLSISAFKGIKNIVLNLKENVLEINAVADGRQKKNGTPLYSNDELGFYYILLELDGVKQPFALSFISSDIFLRENTKESTVYDGDELKNLLMSRKEAPAPREKNTGRMIKLKIGDTTHQFEAYKYNDSAIYHAPETEIEFAFYSLYNSLGYPFFKGKCVQLDFENMMLYVW